MFNLKIVSVAMTAVAMFTATVSMAQEAKAPSAAAICGYKWREAKKADTTLKGREAWMTFRQTNCSSGVKTKNDDAIKQYLEQHKTDATDPTDYSDDRAVIVVAKRK